MLLSSDRAVGVWLLVCCFLVFAMVVLGGVTRLTGSGLSMVRWAPLSGAIPPITAVAWKAEFHHYQQSPQFQKVNHQMTVNEFKTIFYVEYFHRLLGRVIGLAFLVPFLVFLWRGRIPRVLIPKLLLVFVLCVGGRHRQARAVDTCSARYSVFALSLSAEGLHGDE